MRHGKVILSWAGVVALLLLVLPLLIPVAQAQETTASIQGVVKDQTGATVPNATVEVSSPVLIGTKKLQTDESGYYRFANLPPGTYTLTVRAAGFRTSKRENILLATGRLPTIDVMLEVGATTETIEVSGMAPVVDVSQSKVQTNITQDIIDMVPKGRSFQSLILMAPGARAEPLMGGNNTGAVGYQIDGASNAENAYLVEGQETGSIQTGASAANVPMEFIQEVQIKSSGFEAEYGGALGGVVNVIQKHGGKAWHGSVFTSYQGAAFDAGPNGTLRKNPDIGASSGSRLDQPIQNYRPKKDHYRNWDPGFEVGGPLVKDRLWMFLSTVPRFSRLERTVKMNLLGPGNRTFTQAVDTYYSLARLDVLATNKIRLFGSWQYNYQKGRGTSLPAADDVNGARNLNAGDNPDNYNSGIGYVQPNLIYNVGADITITPALVVTTRFGYFFTDYQDRGLPVGIRYFYRDTTYPYSTGNAPAPASLPNINGTDTLGNAAPSLVQSTGFSNIGANSATLFDKYARTSFSSDLAYFKKAFGTHNLKGGYAFNKLSNNVLNGYNTADVYIAFGLEWFPTLSSAYTPGAGRTSPGEHCADVIFENQALYGLTAAQATAAGCRGNWGTVNLRDLGTTGTVQSYNHSLYVQDSWTVGHGVTINAGVRFDKESLPSYSSGYPGIYFGFADKIAPRLGASWDVLRNGKLKAYGSFGYFYDIMKYELPRGSFGGDWWHDCVYTLDSPNFFVGFVPQRSGAGNHYCPGTGDATGTISGGRFIANEDFRVPSNNPRSAIDPITGLPRSGVDPNLKPMKQHELVLGADWAITPTLAFESRWTRKRLDRTIEDAGVLTQFGEQYYIVNPGFGDHAVSCTGCPPNPKAQRRYDGLEFRLSKRNTNKWLGSVSYTYSRLYGNYSGLTASDLADGAGRNSPNVLRAFDEPFMSFYANGKVVDGPLATDRPNAISGFGYYRLKWWKMETWLGIHEAWYSGTPLSTYVSVWGAPVYVEGRNVLVDITRDPATGAWVRNGAANRRTPSYNQTNLNFVHEMHVNADNENMKVSFEMNLVNAFNQHSPTFINQNLIRSGSLTGGAIAGPNYNVLLTGYDYLGIANSQNKIFNSLYGQTYGFQSPREIRFKVKFSF